MPPEIAILTFPLPLGMGTVNCYLLRGATGCVLIDTGGSNARQALRGALDRAGCTAAPFGSCCSRTATSTTSECGRAPRRFRCPDRHGPRRRSHAERGDMFANRNRPNILVRTLVPLFTGFGASERFHSDILFDDGADLSAYGLEAKVIRLPGHFARLHRHPHRRRRAVLRRSLREHERAGPQLPDRRSRRRASQPREAGSTEHSDGVSRARAALCDGGGHEGRALTRPDNPLYQSSAGDLGGPGDRRLRVSTSRREWNRERSSDPDALLSNSDSRSSY